VLRCRATSTAATTSTIATADSAPIRTQRRDLADASSSCRGGEVVACDASTSGRGSEGASAGGAVPATSVGSSSSVTHQR
jgi:hypothetical protein